MVSWLWWRWGIFRRRRRLPISGDLDDFLFVHGLFNYLLLVDGNIDWPRNRNRIWNLDRDWDLHVLAAHLLDDLCALLIVGDVLNHFVPGLTFLLEGLDTLFLGNVDRGLIALCLNSGPVKVFCELWQKSNVSTNLH